MSCFESSTFIPTHEVLNQDLLIQACEKLNWQYQLKNNELVVTHAGQAGNLRGETAIRVKGNQVVWNSYYMKDGASRVDALRNEYQKLYLELRVEYARKAIISEFKKRGFSLLTDLHFQPNEKEKHRFIMKGRSKLKGETEPIAKIKFTILADGTIQTDSNYIPEDVHKLADEAMAAIESHLGTQRDIKPKDIPAKYRNKAFCKRQDVIQLRQGKK